MRLEADNVRIDTIGGDEWFTFTGVCPKCGDTLRVAECQWWTEFCSCGHSWNLEVRIVSDGEISEARTD